MHGLETAKIPFILGGNNACIHGELRRNHNDCGKYQHCVHGIPYDMDCATGTVFSIEANICVGLESPWNDCSQGGLS